jgi:hypothetical protein
VKAFALFAVAAGVITLLGGWVLSLVWSTPDALHAIRVSALVAVGVQLVTFGILRVGRRSNPIAAWGLGTLVRFVVFVLYALLFVKTFGLALTPALMSLALFLFLSTLVEPLLLNV